MIQNIQTVLNFNKKKLNFLKTCFAPRPQTLSNNYYWAQSQGIQEN